MKVFIEAYGCAANQGDASIAGGILESQGHEVVGNLAMADVAMIFTCCVIQRTEQRMLHRLHDLADKHVDLIVAGCMPAVAAEKIADVAPRAALLGPREVHQIGALLDGPTLSEDKAGLPRQVGLQLDVPIADGCRYNCSYCITRRARGQLTSYDEDALVVTAELAFQLGCRELRLTCQDTAAYGMDTDKSLQSLVWRIAMLPGDFRIRVGMMHPLSVIQRPDVLDVFELEKVYRFLHLPLQSGSSRVLHRMRRGYTAQDVLDIALTAQERYPGISISTDVIVAFPGETEQDFKDTCQALQRLQPDVVNVTRFSARPGTPAADMEHPDTREAKNRSRRLSTLVQDIVREQMEQLVGLSTMALLLEQRDGVTVAKTDGYQSVYLPDGEIGTLQRVHITGIDGNHLVGEIDGKEHI